jgi:CheY-like chemotaxis protein
METANASAAGSSALPLVLIVEDHDDTRQMYAEFLGLTFDVRTVGTGQQALDFMARRRPDVAITDIALPGMTGLELVARMRGDAALRDVPIICLSGFDGHAYDELAREAGCDRLIQKPCLPDALAGAVEELLKGVQNRASVL